MKPPRQRDGTCKICETVIGTDAGAFDCDLCGALICIGCSSVPAEVHTFLTDKELFMPILCVSCKEEIPHLRELRGIKTKQEEADRQISALKTENVELKETLHIQGQEITKHEQQLAALTERLNTHEANTNIGGPTYASALKTPSVKSDLSSMVRSEILERAEIEKLKMNLVISGMEEKESDEADKASVTELLEEEFDITLDIASTERIGNKLVKGAPRDGPRLLRLKFITQRSRKEVLSKNMQLRNSESDQVKNNVYIRPDLTERQQKESKSLRDTLKQMRLDNRDKTFKIHRNRIICTSTPEEDEQQEGEME